MLVLGFFVYMLVIFVPILKERRSNPKNVADSDMLTETIEAATEPPPTEPSEPPMMMPLGEAGPAGGGLMILGADGGGDGGEEEEDDGSLLAVPTAVIEGLCDFLIPHEPDEGASGTVWLGCVPIGWEKGWHHLRHIIIRAGSLNWLRFTYEFESRPAELY